jgi:hypothetical protein
VDYFLDKNTDARRKILEAPVFRDNKLPACFEDSYILNPLVQLIENRSAGARKYRKRKLREHTQGNQSYILYKYKKIVCKIESLLWRIGLRF